MQYIYFIGIGGIGMSALARFFQHNGRNVAGYDRTPTPLTKKLESEGVTICYDDRLELIPDAFLSKDNTLIIYTPAVPQSHSQLSYFKEHGYKIIKRSEALGELTKGSYLMAVAGTHGKSSTSTMVTYFNHCGGSNGSGSAFLGAISKNFDSNLILGDGDRVTVEADEFDRSFLQLYPDVLLVTSVDADHLDIYGNHNSLLDSFTKFTSQVKSGGAIIYRYGIPLTVNNSDVEIYSYSLENSESDFYTRNLRCEDGLHYSFDIVCPDRVIEGCTLGVSGRINVENCVGAVAMLWYSGFNEEGLKHGLSTFSGLKRRFDIIHNGKTLYIDDYAHHPSELSATISSVRELFPEREITALFQPHLYSRTRDFAQGFSSELSKVDEIVLLPIYPAREEPIDGVTSEMLLDDITISQKSIIAKDKVIDYLKYKELDILITFGAGDIDTLTTPIEDLLKSRELL